MKKNILFLLFLTLSLTLSANETIFIAEDMYGIDHDKKLIVSNKNVAEINVAFPGLKSVVSLDVDYTFSIPVSTIEKGIPYNVVNSVNSQTYLLYFTELPIIYIDTPHVIVDTPKVWASFRLTESNENSISSDVGIEYRGGYTQSLPKKSLEMEFWEDETGEESVDYSLLGMRTDDSYNLQAMFNEPLRFLSKTNNDLWRLFHTIYYIQEEPEAVNGITMKYSEMFINGEYRGIYAVSEKVDRKQMKLKKHNGNIRGELYKGDQWGNGAVKFEWIGPYDNNSTVWDGFEYKHPKEEINWGNLYNLVNFVKNSSDFDFYSNYKDWIHLDTMIDYFIFLNVLRATDNTGKNLYIAKYDTGEPYYYVPWDLDGTFGINWYGGHDPETTGLLTNRLYVRLLEDCSEDGFRKRLKERWNSAKQTLFNHDFLMNKFQESYDYLLENGVYQREEIAWEEYATEFGHLDYMSNWMTARLTYLDEAFNEGCDQASISDLDFTKIRIYPNPVADFLYFDAVGNQNFTVSLFDLQGRRILKQKIENPNQALSVSSLTSGVYILKINTGKKIQTEKLIISR